MNFNLFSNAILENDRVQLRPLEMDDVTHLLPISLHEPETWEFSLVKADGQANLENYIQLALKAKETQKEFPFIVYDKQSEKYAGSTRFYDINFEFKTRNWATLGMVKILEERDSTSIANICCFVLLSRL